MKKIRKTASFILALCMIMALGVSAFADNDIETAGGSAAAPVLLTTEAATFSATVPTALPVNIAADGTVTCASNLKIVNNSNGQIKVSGIQVSGTDSWELVDFGTNFAAEKTNAKKFGFKIMGSEVPVSGAGSLANFSAIDGNDEMTLTYDAKCASQSVQMSSSQIASVVFTLTWNT